MTAHVQSAPVLQAVPTADEPARAKMLQSADLLIAAAFALLATLITQDAWRDIFRLGFVNEELSYVLLAPIVIGWIAYARRDEIKTCRQRGGWLGILILLFGWAVYWYGFHADPVLWRAGAVVTTLGAFVSIAGSDVFFRFFPAFAATIFLVPISPNGRYRLAIPLQNATAGATQFVCDVLGIYVDRAGNLLSINGVDVTVAEACNGMRMILTLFLVCYVVAFSGKLRLPLRLLLLAATPIVAIIFNVIRLVPTVYLFGHASHQTAEKFHDISGWVMTVLAFLLLMGLFQWLQRFLDSLLNRQPAPQEVTW